MKYNKEYAVKLINDKLNGIGFLTFKEIADITGYHPKYILKLKNEVINNKISITHGNKNKKPHNAISREDEMEIINLYKRSRANVKQFAKFYGKKSYSCVYSVLRRNNLLK